MRRSRIRLAALALVVGLAAGCAGTPATPPRQLITDERLPPPPLPDDLERATGRFLALVLADRDDSATGMLQAMSEREARRSAANAPPSGLLDDATDLLYSGRGRHTYLAYAEVTLNEGDPDPELQRRLERELESEPLVIAERRLSEDRRRKYGSVANRLMKPVSQLALATLNPIETGSAAVASLLSVHGFPEATVQERQALHAYQQFLDQNPNSPEAERVLEQVQHYQGEWRLQVHGEALDAAKRAFKMGRPDVALAHLDRADRLIAGNPEAFDLRLRSDAALGKRGREVRRALDAEALVGTPLPQGGRDAYALLAAAVIASPMDEVEERIDASSASAFAPALDDEIAYVEAVARKESGDERGFFKSLGKLSKQDARKRVMVRHARSTFYDPAQNPYRALRSARRTDRRNRAMWIMLGSRANGPPKRGLPRPVEWVLGLPGMVVAFVTQPLRLIQYPTVRPRFGGPVLHAGEAYVARFPHGAHAGEVHAELEALYATRMQWSRALEHHRERSDADTETVARYRDRIAERTLRAAASERHREVRISIYRSVMQEYADTPHAETARRELYALMTEYTPQNIRLSREFLEESPELWGPDALALSPELFDEEAGDGELADEGITLLGGTLIRIALVDMDSVVRKIPPDDFARFVALLEEAAYERLLLDDRESPVPDPQRDLFFERARLGLTDRPDMRPSAASDAVFLGTSEKYGMVRRRESPLPVELVLQGGLEDFSFAAFPRIKLPRGTADAYLYK
jgi:tetratricopeptide (TPR) repeat protein